MTDEALTLLVVDDEDAVRESFCDYFEDHGFRPLPARSGEAAMELLGVESPDATIVDIRMEGTSGEDFIRKASPQLPGCAFIICTGFSEILEGKTAAQLGVSFILYKPATRRDIAYAIRKVLNDVQHSDH